MALRLAACSFLMLLLLTVAVEGGKPDNLGQFESHELDPGLDELPGGPTLVAHIVPLHHPHDGPLVGAAAVTWQPEPGLDALRNDGGLLPAASEEDLGRVKGVTFGFEQPSMLPGGLGNQTAAPAPAPTPAVAPAAAEAAQPAAGAPKPKSAAAASAGVAAGQRTVEAAAVPAKPVAAQKPAAAQTAAPIPKPGAKPAASVQPVATPLTPSRVLISQGPDYALALPNPAVPQPAGVPAPVIFPAAVAVGARTTLGPFKIKALPPYPLQANLRVGYGDLVPVVQFAHNHYFLYQIPPNPRAVVLLIHGCAGTAFNWWPQSAACNNCRGMPEQMSHTLQALARGYAVLAVSAGDMSTGCWSWNDDADGVRKLVQGWLEQTKLNTLPLYGLGVSSGASFVLKLPRFFKFSGILSEALGIDPGPWSLNKIDGHFPPTLFVSMVKDAKQSAKIGADWSILAEEGSPVGIIRAYERTIYPTYFSDRAPYNISQALSAKIQQALLKIRMIDSFGKVLEEPRYTQRPWLAQLQALVPELGGVTQWENGRALPQWPESAVNMNAKAVWSLVNLAFANHEIISDFATVAFVWFETGGAVDLQPLLTAYTYGRPPWQRGRKALEELDAEPASNVAKQTEARMPADEQQQPAANPSAATAAEQAAAQQLSADESVAQLGGIELAPAAHSAAQRAQAGSNKQQQAANVDQAFGRQQLSEQLASSIPAGGAARCAAALTFVAALAWLVVRRGRSGFGYAGLPAGALNAGHAAAQHGQHHGSAAGQGLPSIIPGVRKQFDLTEVVEQTGSPFSARRRMRTAFHSDAAPHTGSIMPNASAS